MKLHKKQCLIIIICLCFSLILLYSMKQSHSIKITFPKAYSVIVTRLEEKTYLDKEQISKDIRTLQTLYSETSKKLTAAESFKMKLDEYKSAIEEKQKLMFDAQDYAIQVGKFTCKLNTCQGDPNHENYSSYIKATDDLVNAKENLQKAKDSYEYAKDEAELIDSYKALLDEMRETQSRLETEKKK